MFSGIIQAKTSIHFGEEAGFRQRVRFAKPASWKLAKGQSISIDGICSTVVEHGMRSFDVEYMPETLSKNYCE